MLAFPSSLPKPISGGFAPSVKSLSGGQSLSGFEQVQTQMADRWMASYAFAIRRDADVLAFRAFVLSMRGRANTVSLPAFDLARAPWPVVAGKVKHPGKVRGPYPSLDNTPYADPVVEIARAGLITARARVSAGLNATAIDMEMTSGSAPKPGHLFSIGNRLYSVLTVSGTGPFVLSIWPWLRSAVTAGTAMEFATPACEMRFASDNEGVDALSKLAQLRYGTITLNFDEVA